MKVTVFTGNQPRHLSLIKKMAEICDEVFAVQECNTVFPGQIKDIFNDSTIMNKYFYRMRDAERKVFGNIGFLNFSNTRTLCLKSGDLNFVSREMIEPALKSDIYIVFGSSYIHDTWLIDFLLDNRAINIHMGVSPYYRGAACNFWALYDGHPEMVGATIILLGRGLDSGNILYHALPPNGLYEAFELGMRAVESAQNSLKEKIIDGSIYKWDSIEQDKVFEIRYSRNKDFTEQVAGYYLEHVPSSEDIRDSLISRDYNKFIRPYVG